MPKLVSTRAVPKTVPLNMHAVGLLPLVRAYLAADAEQAGKMLKTLVESNFDLGLRAVLDSRRQNKLSADSLLAALDGSDAGEADRDGLKKHSEWVSAAVSGSLRFA